MNIFILNVNPKNAAQEYHDSHVVKIILECAQCLCNVYHDQGINAPYKKTHFNHPVSVWMRSSRANFVWSLSHLKYLLREYNFRYGKTHKTTEIYKWLIKNKTKLQFKNKHRTPFALAMPNEYKINDFDVDTNAVLSYRQYYIKEKLVNKNDKLNKWTKRCVPEWINK